MSNPRLPVSYVREKRSRVVCLRFTEREYDAIVRGCAASGAPSTADGIRDILLTKLGAQIAPNREIEARVSELEQRVRYIEGGIGVYSPQ